jgi:hypothetical protein
MMSTASNQRWAALAQAALVVLKDFGVMLGQVAFCGALQLALATSWWLWYWQVLGL